MEAVEQWKEEVDEVLEEALLGGRHENAAAGTNGASNGQSSVDLEPLHLKGSLSAREEEGNGKLERSVYFDDDEGIEVEWSLSQQNLRVEDLGVKLNDLDIPKVLSAVLNDEHEQNPKDKSLSGFSLPPPERSREEENSHHNPLRQEGTEHVTDDLIEETDEEVIELELERAVEKLHTHNIYCPNCDSCITKVILRRKRRVNIPFSTNTRHHDQKDGSLLHGQPLRNNGVVSASTTKPQEAEKYIGTSLPQVSVPPADVGKESGNGFNLFRIFGKRRENKITQNLPQEQKADANVPSSDVTHDKGNMVIKQENNYGQHMKANEFAAPDLSYNSNDALVHDQKDGSLLHGQALKNNGVVSASTTEPQEARKYIGTSLPQVSVGFGKWICYSILFPIFLTIKKINSGRQSKVDSKLKSQIPPTDVEKESGVIDTARGPTVLAETQDSRIPDCLDRKKETQDSKSLEILKSIVYGGLMESIASLSVVSSAAASDATTLNIIALGLANLIGGLFIICHNLMNLKNDHSEGATNQTNQVDRYKELLGRRKHFLLHSTVAVLSFLVFGLIPPVIYGFSFRKSDDRDLKVVAVAVASLLCVAILAIAKTYIRRPSKFNAYMKSVLYYVSMTVMVSAVPYAVGNLIKRLMHKLGWFESDAAVDLSFPETTSVNPAWASY